MKKSLMALLVASAVSFTGTTSATVPVTINYTGGCQITNLQSSYDLSAISSILDDGGVPANPINFQVKCTQGINYQVKLDKNYYTPSVGGSTYGIAFYDDASLQNQVTTSGINRTGTGEIETISLFPKIYANGGDCNSLGYDIGKTICDAGTITASVNITLEW